MDFDEALDTTGLVCPEPLMLVRNAVRKLAGGAVLRVIASDPTTERDFQHFCQFMGQFVGAIIAGALYTKYPSFIALIMMCCTIWFAWKTIDFPNPMPRMEHRMHSSTDSTTD